MATRAIGSNSISTFGGYTSTSLDYWQEVRSLSPGAGLFVATGPSCLTLPRLRCEQGNNGQMWTITSA